MSFSFTSRDPKKFNGGSGKKICGVVVLASLSWAFAFTEASALDAYPGCDVPAAKPGHKMFYVDPTLGSMGNDGSAAHPWHTLEEVLDPANHLLANGKRDVSGRALVADGPIGSGDVIYLMSGNHGSPRVAGAVNSDFVSVVAAPEQTPVVNSLTMKGASHWLFRGIKFQGVKPAGLEYARLVDIRSGEGQGASDNIVFAGDSFSTEDSTALWTPEDWVKRPYATGLASEATCTSIVDNHFYNLRDGIGISGDRSLLQNNAIEETGNDSIDMAASDLIIRRNRIGQGRHTPAEPLHPDAIQGWTQHGATNRNVVVDANSIINLNPAPDNARQGISIFDGRWEGLVVSNNLVITNAWHGIALYGVSNALVVNNTVIPARRDMPTWIMIHDSKEHVASDNVVVRNNIAAQLIVAGHDVTVDHNVVEKRLAISTGNGPDGNVTKGGLGDHNLVDPGVFQAFVDFEPSKEKFDLRPGPASAALKSGSDALAPSVDIDGRPRAAPVDIGAYAR